MDTSEHVASQLMRRIGGNVDLTNLERATGRPLMAACNGTDERLDVLIGEVRTLIAEMRITREEWKRMIEEVAALPREATVDHIPTKKRAGK